MQAGVDVDVIEHSIGWQRIDPNTIFDPIVYKEYFDADETSSTKALINMLPVDDDFWGKINKTKESFINQVFQKWDYWDTIRELD